MINPELDEEDRSDMLNQDSSDISSNCSVKELKVKNKKYKKVLNKRSLK